MADHANITRRTALKSIVSIPAACAVPVVAFSLVHVLINLHHQKFEEERAARREVSDLQDLHDDDMPEIKVQTGNLYLGRDDDGKNLFRPIYAYSEEGIVKEFAAHIRTAFNDKQRQQYVTKRDGLIAELQAMKAKEKAIEGAAGITVALAKARALTDECNNLLEDLIASQPETLAEATAKSRYLHEVFQTGEVEYDAARLLNIIGAMNQVSA